MATCVSQSHAIVSGRSFGPVHRDTDRVLTSESHRREFLLTKAGPTAICLTFAPPHWAPASRYGKSRTRAACVRGSSPSFAFHFPSSCLLDRPLAAFWHGREGSDLPRISSRSVSATAADGVPQSGTRILRFRGLDVHVPPVLCLPAMGSSPGRIPHQSRYYMVPQSVSPIHWFFLLRAMLISVHRTA